MRPALVCRLAAAMLAACGPPRPPSLPDGRFLEAAAVDGEHALVAVEHDRRVTMALVGGEVGGEVRVLWTAPLPGSDDDPLPFRRMHAIAGEHLVMLGEITTVFARADGRVLTRSPLLPASLAQRIGQPGATDLQLAGTTVYSAVGDEQRTWVTAYDPAAGRELWQIGRAGLTELIDLGASTSLGLRSIPPPPRRDPAEAEADAPAPEGTYELVDARSGQRRAQISGRQHCVAGETLFVVDDELRLTAIDLEQPRPRVVLPALALPGAARWDLETCHHRGHDVWLGFTDGDAVLVVDVDLERGRERGRVGLCDQSFAGPTSGRWMVVEPATRGQAVAIHDVERGRLAWVQDRSIDRTHYTTYFTVDGVLYLRGLVDAPTRSREIWRLVALDSASGEVLGAAAVDGVDAISPGDVRDGQLWLFHPEVDRGAVALVRLDVRTLQPRAPLPRGLAVIDTTVEARASLRPAADHEPGVSWDPAATDPISRLMRCSEPAGDAPGLDPARERAR